MSVLPGSSRTSKTVVIVVLVVFFQVLVIAVLGLRAIRDDRDASREQARVEAQRSARKQLNEIRRSVLGEVREVVREVGEETGYEALARRRRRRGEVLFREVFHFPPRSADAPATERVVLWVDLRTPLYIPEAIARAELERAEASRAEADLRLSKTLVSETAITPAQRAARLEGYLMTHGWHVGSDQTRYPLAADAARRLMEVHAGLLRERPLDGATPQTGRALALRTAVFLALRVRTQHADRDGVIAEDREIFDAIDRGIDEVAALASLQGHRALGDEVAAYRRSRAFLLDSKLNTTVIQSALARTDDLRSQFAPGTVLVFSPALKELVGVVPEANGAVALVRLDASVLESRFEAAIGEAGFDRLGTQVVLGRSSERPKGEALVQTIHLEAGTEGEDEGAAISTNLRASIYQVEDPAAPGEGRSEPFYWGIILLAGFGITLGGVVLVRLMTREIRLARLKADFAGNLSHELKTPLTSIALFTEMLEDGKIEDEADRKEAYSILSQESERLQRIVGRMLRVARQEAGGVPYELEPGDLNEPIEAAAARFRRIVTEPGLDLVVIPSPETLPALMDRQAMDDVITNLLSNAWKYRRGDAASIRLRAQRKGRFAEITVDDDGVGIAPGERKRVFEMFYRSNQLLTQDVPGTGLGLSLVRTIVRGHGGRVRLSAGPGGVGTRFTVRLPLSGRPGPRASTGDAPGTGRADDPSPSGTRQEPPVPPEGAQNGIPAHEGAETST